MPIVKIPLERIVDKETFHDVFRELLGFPDFYGRNMAAWIDCLSSLDEPDHAMTSIHISEGEVLAFHLEGYPRFKERNPDLLEDLVESAAFVNWRRVASGMPPLIALAYYD